jgi:HTH-type transcriptional regulator/antitoxin MqsA
MTQGQAAKLFGGGPVAFTKYENDDVMQSEAMDTLLRLVRRSQVAFKALVEEKSMQAEFNSEPATEFVKSNVFHVPASRWSAGERFDPDPHYNQRRYRRFAVSTGAMPWKQ